MRILISKQKIMFFPFPLLYTASAATQLLLLFPLCRFFLPPLCHRRRSACLNVRYGQWGRATCAAAAAAACLNVCYGQWGRAACAAAAAACICIWVVGRVAFFHHRCRSLTCVIVLYRYCGWWGCAVSTATASALYWCGCSVYR